MAASFGGDCVTLVYRFFNERDRGAANPNAPFRQRSVQVPQFGAQEVTWSEIRKRILLERKFVREDATQAQRNAQQITSGSDVLAAKESVWLAHSRRARDKNNNGLQLVSETEETLTDLSLKLGDWVDPRSEPLVVWRIPLERGARPAFDKGPSARITPSGRVALDHLRQAVVESGRRLAPTTAGTVGQSAAHSTLEFTNEVRRRRERTATIGGLTAPRRLIQNSVPAGQPLSNLALATEHDVRRDARLFLLDGRLYVMKHQQLGQSGDALLQTHAGTAASAAIAAQAQAESLHVKLERADRIVADAADQEDATNSERPRQEEAAANEALPPPPPSLSPPPPGRCPPASRRRGAAAAGASASRKRERASSGARPSAAARQPQQQKKRRRKGDRANESE